MSPTGCLLLVLAAIAGLGSCSGTSPCSRYAAPDGSDRADGTRAHPLRTPQRLVAALKPGETGCLRAGTYPAGRDGYVLSVARSDVEVRSDPGERARLVGTVMVDHSAHDVTLADLAIVGTGGQNTVKIYGRDVVIEDSDITNARRGESCVILGSSLGGRAVRPVVRRSVLHECGATADDNKDHGIYVARADGGEIVDNVFVAPAAYAIQLYPDAQGVHVARNVIDGGGPQTVRGGIVIGGDENTASSGNTVENNVIAYTATAGIDTYWQGRVGKHNTESRNCFWQAHLEAGGAGVTADPGFRDPAHGDYRLARAGPCAIVAGFAGHSSTLGR